MKNKILTKLFVVIGIFSFGLTGCAMHDGANTPDNSADNSNKDYSNDPRYRIYQMAVNEGFTGTYEEWLKSIKGQDGKDGETPIITIGSNGHWYINGVDTGVNATGQNGNDGISIVSIIKTGTNGNIDTYTITYSNNTTSTFTVTNGTDGQSIQGQPGQDGHTPVITIGNNGNWFVDGVDTNIQARGPQGDPGASVLTGNSAPSESFGRNGDSYIDLSTWNYYLKENNIWNLKGNLKGTQGEQGDNGVSVVSAYINDDGDLIIVLSNQTEINAGNLIRNQAYVVTFDTDGGNYIEPQIIIEGSKIQKPNDPTKEGYEFVKWVDNNGDAWVFNGYTVTSNLTLHAIWKHAKYTITLNPNGGSVVENTIIVYYSEAFILPTPTYEGMRFLGWYLDDQKVESGNYLYTNSITLKAKWTDTPEPELASGYFDYQYVNSSEKANILGALEKYAMDTHLSGITFTNGGRYVLFDDGIQKGSDDYIPNYGFGVLKEGNITSPLSGDSINPNHNMYYHTYTTSDPKSLNNMDSKVSIVETFDNLVSASYFTKEMNSTKDGYIWVGDLAKSDRPTPLNLDAETGKATKFRFPVKVGEEAHYKISTSINRLSAYDGRCIELEDYITPFQILYTQAYMLRQSTALNFSGLSEIKGVRSYYSGSKAGFNEEAWENVGIKAYEEGGISYLEFEFVNPCTPFYAMYYLSSTTFAPVPKSFILACGGESNSDINTGVAAWGAYNEGNHELPSDHFLSTGPYFVSEWNIDQNIVFQKNLRYEDNGKYKIPGVDYKILPTALSDIDAVLNEFLDGNLSEANVPTNRYSSFKNDPRISHTISNGFSKLNLNTCSADRWEELFGEHGSIVQTKKSNYWKVEPAMSNDNFIDGLSYAIDRISLCDELGLVPSFDYFSDNYLIDPENGISYNSTQAHKNAIADALSGTDGYGYSLELAKQSFRTAVQELIDNGDYEAGDTITIELCWMYESDIDEYAQIPQDIETAFNSCGGDLTLDIDVVAVKNPYDVYYNKLMVGQFDIGFGSIGGDFNDPIDHIGVLKSDNTSGCTLNWGVDTNSVDGSIVYDNKVWSFNALWEVAMKGGIAKNGQAVSLVTLEDYDVERKANGDLVVYLWADFQYVDEKNYAKLVGICLYAALTDPTVDYNEVYVTIADEEHCYFDKEEGCYVFIFDAEIIEQWLTLYPSDAKLERQGFDLYLDYLLDGKPYDEYYELNEEGTEGCYYTSFWTNQSIPAIPQP